VENKPASRLKNKYVIIGIVLVVLIAALTGVASYAYIAGGNGTAMDGVHIGDIDLSGKSMEEAEEELKEKISIPAENIKFVCDDRFFEISPSQIGLEVDVEATLDAAFGYGKETNPVKKIVSFYSTKLLGADIGVKYICDETALMGAIEENLEDIVTPVIPYSVETGEDCIIVTNGEDGTKISPDDISTIIYGRIENSNLSEPIVLSIVEDKAKDIDFNEFVALYQREATDAQYSEKDGGYIFTKEVTGISFETETARAIIEENRENKEPYKIPAKITLPKVTVDDLQAKFASEVIAQYSTSFASSDANRASNVSLAASKINGIVLNPGERFSYNKIVGPRTAATGFKIAHVYEGDRVVDGMGGGICQVSSTLYNAVLLADLKIVYRLNHSMPVSYVPLGRDATVSYGTIDFVFENNKSHPIKICATSHNRQLVISINGAESDKVNVSLVTENAGYTPYSTKKVEDPSLSEGETKVVKNGANGSIVKLYKVYTLSDGTKRTEFVSKSAYLPTTKVVNVGVKKETPVKDEKKENEQVPVINDNPDVIENSQKPQDPSEKTDVQENATEDEMAQTPIENEESKPAFAPENESEIQDKEEISQETETFEEEIKNEEEISE
jgi:vancomycin resistance protein YoaR